MRAILVSLERFLELRYILISAFLMSGLFDQYDAYHADQ